MNRIFIALDTSCLDKALGLAERVAGCTGGFKIGKTLFTAVGPQGVLRLADFGLPVFLDLKFHDIPNTVAGAVGSALMMRPFMLNLHISGGKKMIEAAVVASKKACLESEQAQPLMIGVTILTAMNDQDIAAVGMSGTVKEQVRNLAALAVDSGLDGVVCSAQELEMLREACPADFKLVVPGIRPLWACADDQKRTMTPKEALARGADFLVIGRPVTGAADPKEALERILEETAL